MSRTGEPQRQRTIDDEVRLAHPPPPEVRALGPWGTTGLALAVVLGVLVAHPLSLLVPVGVVAVALVARRPAVLVLAAALAGSALGQRAEAGLAPPARTSVAGEVTLVGDPEVRWGRVEAIVRLDGRLVLLEADGAAAEVVAPRLAGEAVTIEGRLGPPPRGAPWLRVRHVSGSLRVARAEAAGPGALPWRVANRLRRVLVDGAAHMDDERRALFTGLVLGDDREQSPEVADDFRGSGLSHLLAVSGQNVAFVVALAWPALRRVGVRGRVLGVGVVLGLFVVLTRGEPSVLRAVAMAMGAAVAAARGRPTSAVQLLGVAVAGCVLVDPLLVRATGFHLSVAATAGIVVLGPRLAAAVPGPRAVVVPVAVSAAAQLGVAPLVVASFDGVPVVSSVANVLAAPAAALVMTWGLPAGVVAGALGPPVAAWAHLPTSAALAWLAGVARVAASAPLGRLEAPHVAALAVVVAVVVLAARRGSGVAVRVLRCVSVGVVAAVLAQPAVALRSPPDVVVAEGVAVWRAGGAAVVVVEAGTGPVAVLEGLRSAGVVRVDLLVVGGGASAGDEERAARHRAAVRGVWWRGRSPPLHARIGGLVVRAEGDDARVARGPAP